MVGRSFASGIVLLFLFFAIATSLPATAEGGSSSSFILPGSSITSCWFYGVEFAAMQGQRFVLQWTQNISAYGPISVNFFIVPLGSVYELWPCDQGPVYLYWYEGAYGTANWAAPSGGAYAVVLVNYSYYPVAGSIVVTAISGGLSTHALGPSLARRAHYCADPNCMSG